LFDGGFQVTEENIKALLDYCKEHEIAFVTIDSLIRVHGSNENDAMEMSKVFSRLKKLTAAGIGILITHHNRKPGGNSIGGSQEMRGSSDILAALDCHIAIKRSGRKLKLTQTKLRLCEEMPPIEVELVEGDDGRVNFKYVGATEPHSAASRSEEIVSKLNTVFSTHQTYNQSQLLRQLAKNGMHVSVNTLKRLLDEMVRSKVLRVDPGERNSLVYTLVDAPVQ
jgi:hypothetical protein